MANTGTTRPGSKRWRWLALGTLGVAGIVGGWYGFRANGLTRAHAQPGAAAVQPAGTAPAADYDRRVVAYLYENEAVTRDELGEYLIARRGPEKLDAMINRHIIDLACQARNIQVTGAEVENALAESIKGLNIGRERFVKEYLKGIHKSLFEWKEDVLRPKLMLSKLCRERVKVSDEEIRQAFESKYGEKVECRIIVWPLLEAEPAQREYARLRDSEEAFAAKAKSQFNSALASMGGKVKPIGRYTFSYPKVEEALFKLRPGEVSELVTTGDGITLIKCDSRLPADTTVSLDAKRDELAMAVAERKLQYEIGKFIKESREQAAIKPALTSWEEMQKLLQHPGHPGQVLATMHGNINVTRQELGEYLITRYGAEALEMLLNAKIIDKECKARGITVTDQEVEDTFKADLARMTLDEKKFIAEFLIPNGKSLFEWKEDMLRPKLLMTKLAREQVKATDEDLRAAFDSIYGERIKGRLILWKTEERKFALSQYSQLRDTEALFDAAARRQFNPGLAAKRGEVPAFARHTTGLAKLEDEAFRLQPGEVSALVELPEGCAIFKCDERIPPQAAKLEEKRAELTPLVLERKTEASIATVFAELRTKANPKPLLKDAAQPEDLAASVRRDLAPPAPPTQPVPPPGLPHAPTN